MKVISPAAIAASPLIERGSVCSNVPLMGPTSEQIHHNVGKTVPTSYSGDATL